VLEAWFANKFRAIAIEQSDHTMLLRILPSRLFRHVPELNVVARREERLRERFNSTGVVVPAASVHVGRELQSNAPRWRSPHCTDRRDLDRTISIVARTSALFSVLCTVPNLDTATRQHVLLLFACMRHRALARWPSNKATVHAGLPLCGRFNPSKLPRWKASLSAAPATRERVVCGHHVMCCVPSHSRETATGMPPSPCDPLQIYAELAVASLVTSSTSSVTALSS